MEREKAKELSDILKAYSNGKTIQSRDLKGWNNISATYFKYFIKNFDEQVLRIKPEKTLVPFTFEDNLLGAKVIYSDGTRAMITAQKKDGVYIGGSLNLTSYISLMTLVKFEKGSPCGKYIQE